MGVGLTRENDPRVVVLRHRLDDFYATTKNYVDFEKQTDKTDFWGPITRAIRERVTAVGTCRVLEFGAGRTEFGSSLGVLRSKVQFDVQDVTPANHDHLRGQADRVTIGDIKQITGPYDVIFSTFVWEHITDPRAVLEHLLGILNPGGSLFIACPRYDLPGYIPPSARHYTGLRQYTTNLGLMWRRMLARTRREPGFWVHVDPAVFHKPFFIDADAVHWASLHDLRVALPSGYTLERVPVKVGPGSFAWRARRLLFTKCLLLFVRIRKPESARNAARAPVGAAAAG